MSSPTTMSMSPAAGAEIESAHTVTSSLEPPLFMSGRNFVRPPTEAGSESTPSTRHHRESDAHINTQVQQDSMSTFSTMHVDLTRSEEVDRAQEKSGQDQGIIEDDEQVLMTVAAAKQQMTIAAKEEENIRWLELTGRQLEEMANVAEGSHRIEYFDTKYFAEQAFKVWEERRGHESPTRRRGPDQSSSTMASPTKIAPPSSAILAGIQHSPMKFARSAGAESAALGHPLLHRKAAQNEERRAAFRAAALERKGIPASEVSGASLYTPQRDLFQSVLKQPNTTNTEATLRKPADPVPLSSGTLASKGETQTLAAAGSPVAASSNGGGVDDTSAAPKSLSALLKEQQTLLTQMREHDEQVYQPLLNSFYRYDEQVQAKMTRILAMVTDPPVKADSDAPSSS